MNFKSKIEGDSGLMFRHDNLKSQMVLLNQKVFKLEMEKDTLIIENQTFKSKLKERDEKSNEFKRNVLIETKYEKLFHEFENLKNNLYRVKDNENKLKKKLREMEGV